MRYFRAMITMTNTQIIGAIMLVTGKSVSQVAAEYGYSKRTFYRAINNETNNPKVLALISTLFDRIPEVLREANLSFKDCMNASRVPIIGPLPLREYLIEVIIARLDNSPFSISNQYQPKTIVVGQSNRQLSLSSKGGNMTTSSPENVQLQGRRIVSGVRNHPELTAKLRSKRWKINKFLLCGIREFQKQGSGSDIDAKHIAISGK